MRLGGGETSSSVGARLDRVSLSPFHYQLGLIVSAGLLVDSVDIYVTTGVAAALVSAGEVTMEEVGRLAMMTTLFLAIGGFLVGLLADRFGRLTMMRVTMATVVCGGIGASLAPSFDFVVIWRAVTALGLGGETVLAYGVLTEFMPARSRGRCMAGVGLLSSFGLPLSLALGALILPQPDGWRWLIAVPTAAGVLILILRSYLPESPRWLESKGRAQAAEAIVVNIEASARGRTSVETSVPTPTPTKTPLQAGVHGGQIWRRFITGGAIHIATMSAVFGFVSWLPTFFAAAGHDVATSTLFSTLMTLGAPAGTLIALVLTDRFERKWMVVGAALLASIFGVIYANASEPTAILALGFLVVTAIYAFATIGLFSYVPELFPTKIRLGAIGFVSTVGRATAFGLPLLIVPLFAASGQLGVLSLIVAILLTQALIVAFLGAPTRRRSLEQV